jgi:hypothetical protein
MKPQKVVVFDLDETLGSYTQLGIFGDALDIYFNSEFTNINFNELLDLYPEFIRPKLFSILKYLKQKKLNKECSKVMIYTNNQGPKSWAESIQNYFDDKINYKLFDQIIAAFKIGENRVELCRTSNEKSVSDFLKCTKLPSNVEICFLDDQYHAKMEDENVYYINVKPYCHHLSYNEMINRFINSSLGKYVRNKDEFRKFVINISNKYQFKIEQKCSKEHNIDKIIGKKILYYLKLFFNDLNSKTMKKKKTLRGKTLKKLKLKHS